MLRAILVRYAYLLVYDIGDIISFHLLSPREDNEMKICRVTTSYHTSVKLRQECYKAESWSHIITRFVYGRLMKP